MLLSTSSLKTYVTGSTSRTLGIIAVYDVFGEMPQTLQGADRMAESVGALVLMPDFFKGEPLPLSLYPPDTDEKKKTAMSFMATTANVDGNVVKLVEVVKEAKGKGEYGSVKSWGTYGLCWGGKVSILASGADTEFKASGTAHPGRLAVDDVKKLTVPFCCLFSKEDGTLELVEDYIKALEKSKENYVEKYSSMHHGWMGARAFLEDSENLKDYERG
ncbi:hypothetical protein OEA41_001173 [Lepraria neglecta]|uniref:Dienelactone hydrolase domain-containing protein n=1 Tax=Lepraria neglecta TaxID=209136 RepID=A0AAE0DQ45_9LECA|nr:hypothetical protein OEA41_001173 [Lepraria neglecta]